MSELDEIFADADQAVESEDWDELRECLVDALREIEKLIRLTRN